MDLVHLKPKPRWAHKPGDFEAASGLKVRERGEEQVIVCARCNARITTAAARTRINGLHEHSQVNPHGYIWNFGCFLSAPGCMQEGKPSSEFAWFPGFRWQIEICRGCALHLGWLFSSVDHQFHGLILERIAELPASGPGDH